MNSTVAAPRSSRAVSSAVIAGGLLSGALDITAAFVVYGYFGARPIPLLQGIAAGLLGSRAHSGGLATALLGLFLQFIIALGASAVFVVATRWIPFLLNRPFVCGPLYGIAVYFFMNRIVVPLSAAHKYPFTIPGMLIGVVIHIFCVGLPIALVARRFLRQSPWAG